MIMNYIIYNQPDGVAAVVIPTGAVPIEEVIKTAVPAGVTHVVVPAESIPWGSEFRDAWTLKGRAIKHDMTKAKAIAHDRRRSARAEEFAPLDDIISKRIPGTTAEEAEASRQRIRDKYAKQQAVIDAATTVDQLKEALK